MPASAWASLTLMWSSVYFWPKGHPGIDLSGLVAHVIGLDEAPAALAALGEGAPAGITVIRP